MMGDYELLDFGHGRRLERFGAFVLDRPCPGTEHISLTNDEFWAMADARYEGDRSSAGDWSTASAAMSEATSEGWTINAGEFSLRLHLAPSGQVGMFPEQMANWRWIAERVRSYRKAYQTSPRVINLFAYTGGSTLAAAAAGAEVAHVDSSRSVVNWARQNATLSQLADAPIRWLVEDARRFVQREARRGKTYHGIVLDPPSYGHGGGKRVWKIENDLLPLLSECLALVTGTLEFLLLTSHSPEFNGPRLAALIQQSLTSNELDTFLTEHGELMLTTPSGRALPSGHFARIHRQT